MLADPHGQRGAGRQGQEHEQVIQEVGFRAAVHGAGAQANDDADGHDAAQRDGDHAGDLRDLLAALLAFLLQALQCRDGNAEQLHDDGRGDVGRDAHRKDREVGEVLAIDEVEHAQQGDVVHLLGDVLDVDAGDRDDRADAVDQEHDQRVDDLLAEILHLPGIAESFKHVRSPLLSHHLPRSSALRWRRTWPP